MAGQQTMSSQDGHLSEQTFGLLVILTGHINKPPEKKYIYTQHYVSKGQTSFLTLSFSLLG